MIDVIQEPMTVATDYVLAIAAAIFAARLWRTNPMWSLAFLFTAAGSFFGGTYHGWPLLWALAIPVLLWKLTMLSIGTASFFLLAGSSRSLLAFGAVKYIIYLGWILIHSEFTWVIIDYGLSLLIVAIVVRTKWVIGSVIASVIGALVQQSGFALHEHFNHNDLYHAIQLVALWLLYRGGKLMNPSTAPLTNQPT